MGRSGRIAAVAAFFVATVFAFAPVRPAPAPDLCVGEPGTPQLPGGFCYHGAHWKITDLPVRVRLNATGAMPSTISPAEFKAAAVAAAAAWNAVWPYPGLDQAECLESGVPATAICIEALGSSMSPNVVSWGASSGLATTTRCIGESLSTCQGSTGGGHIAKATIVISTSFNWEYLVPEWPYDQDDAEVLAYQAGLGEARGGLNGLWNALCPANPPVEALCPGWYDIDNLLAHEFGHLLGLDHPPNPLDWMQTMFADIFPGETSKRTLHYGDIAGIQLVAADSLAAVAGF